MKYSHRARKTIHIVGVLIGMSLFGIGAYLLYGALHASPRAIPSAPLAEAKASSQKKTTVQKDAYQVPASYPRRMAIAKLNIDAIVLPVGQKDGAVDAPESAWDAGWYEQSGLPGRVGAMLLDGHVNDALGSPGIFYNLTSLTPGDAIEIERGDGRRFSYKVVLVQDIPLDKVDMTKLLEPITDGAQGLNLISCGGMYDSKKKTYDHRVLVFATKSDDA